MSTMPIPKTFDEYVRLHDLVPREPLAYLRRFNPDAAKEVERLRVSPGDLAARLANARRVAGGSVRPAPRGAAPARRALSSPAVRVAAAVDEFRNSGSSPGVLAGYAALYNRPSDGLPFQEVLAPGAFRSTLAKVKAGDHDVLAFTEHDRRNVLGRVSAGNLKLEEDSRGLRFTLELPDTQLARDTRELVRRGILKGMSFSFSVVKDSWSKAEGGRSRRTVHDLLAFEISIVGTPAYPSTSVVASRFLPGPATWHVAALRALAARGGGGGGGRRAVSRGTFGSIEHR